MKILIPDIGDFKDVAVIEVLAATGDSVAAEQSLLTLESDKATMEVPSPSAGRIVAVHVKPGDRVSAGTHIADLESDSQPAADSDSNSRAESKSESAPPPESKTESKPQPPAAAREVRTPDIGDFKEVAIIEILIKPGDEVAAEQSLLTLESDKATMDIPAPFGGVVQSVAVKVGDKISHGDVIALVAPADSQSKTPPATSPVSDSKTDSNLQSESRQDSGIAKKAEKDSSAVLQTSPSAAEGGHKPHASPSVRKFARELGANLADIRGSGPRGRVLKGDVQAHVKAAMSRQQGAPSAGGLPPPPSVDFSQFGEVEMTPLPRIRKLSAGYLSRNWLLAPHVTQCADADITDMEEFRKSLAEETKKEGYRMTPLAFFIRAAALTLREFPHVNASLLADGETVAQKKYFHIGVAVDTPAGLVVPVIRDALRKGLTDLALELSEMSARARAGKLKAEEMQGGCFTISSLGGIGGSYFTPIINLPEAAIMGVSRSQIRPQWNGKEFTPRLMLPLSLSYDHRLIDGAEGARFITHYAALLTDIRRLSL